MEYSTVAFGTTVVRHLQQRASTAIVTIGSDHYTRTDLAGVTCFNFIAAAHLNSAIKSLDVKSTRDLFRRIEPAALAKPGIGTYAYVVLAAIFEHDGLGSIEDWLRRSVKKATASSASRASRNDCSERPPRPWPDHGTRKTERYKTWLLTATPS